MAALITGAQENKGEVSTGNHQDKCRDGCKGLAPTPVGREGECEPGNEDKDTGVPVEIFRCHSPANIATLVENRGRKHLEFGYFYFKKRIGVHAEHGIGAAHFADFGKKIAKRKVFVAIARL